MTDIRSHIALIDNDDTIFDLSTDETLLIIDDLTLHLSTMLTYTMTNISDSHLDDYAMISSILTALLPITSYAATDMTDDEFSAKFDATFTTSLINDILYFNHYNNCAPSDATPLIFNHLNTLTETELDALIND